MHKNTFKRAKETRSEITVSSYSIRRRKDALKREGRTILYYPSCPSLNPRQHSRERYTHTVCLVEKEENKQNVALDPNSGPSTVKPCIRQTPTTYHPIPVPMDYASRPALEPDGNPQPLKGQLDLQFASLIAWALGYRQISAADRHQQPQSSGIPQHCASLRSHEIPAWHRACHSVPV